MLTAIQNAPVDFCVVILHYLESDLTVGCIESFLEKDTGSFRVKVIVVDNASPDSSGKVLREKYAGTEAVTIIAAEENLGFAAGNNLGFSYAKKHYDPSFIICSNNDVLVETREFYQKIKEAFDKGDWYILGPDIYNPLKKHHQNPHRMGTLSFQDMEEEKRSLTQRLEVLEAQDQTLARMKIFSWRFRETLVEKNGSVMKVWQALKRVLTRRKEGVWSSQQKNVVLHGACIVFARPFIEIEDYAFPQRTFLYYEEDFLFIHMGERSAKMLYDPEVKVLHYDGGATKRAEADYVSREILMMKRRLEALSILKEYRGDGFAHG